MKEKKIKIKAKHTIANIQEVHPMRRNDAKIINHRY